MENIFENFVISVLKLYRIIQKIKNYEMREYGLKSVHVMCIYYLNENKEGLTFGELMRLTLEDKAVVSRSVKELSGKGFVKYDSKKYNSPVTLTEKGTEVAAKILEKADSAVKAGSADLTDGEREKFHNALKEVSVNLKQYYDHLENDE